jgi:hypothetical protein
MTDKLPDTHSHSPATEPLALRLSEGLGAWVFAWFARRYEDLGVFDDGPEALTLEAACQLVADAQAAERERCCRIVAVQRDDDRYDVARRTILAIRAGHDFHDVDDDVLRS